MRTTMVVVLAVTFGSAGCRANSPRAEADPNAETAKTPVPPVTAIPSEPVVPASTPAAQTPTPPTKHTMAGRDVFRINCMACHAQDGAGTPQAPALTKASRALAAGSGESELRRRLSSGGEKMPAFPYLEDAEVDALVGYLRELGGGAPAPAATVAALSGGALGERIYRSNCSSCHDSNRAAATGMMCQPATLAGATDRFTKAQVMKLLDVGVGPMPAFGHLNADERDGLWAYLESLPAEPGSRPTMGQMCPMVRAAMEDRPMGMMHDRGMMGPGKMGPGKMGPGKMGSGEMGPGMMRGQMMMRRGMGCPMMRPSSAGDEPEVTQQGGEPLPPCCR